MWEETGRLQALGDSGALYDLVEFTYCDADSATRERNYALLDGTVVSVAKDGSFAIFETGEILRRL